MLKKIFQWNSGAVEFIEQPILLAEDNEHDAVLFKHQLTIAKIYNPLHIVSDGGQVIDYLDGQREYADRSLYPLPIILFLDLHMPKISGYQILSFLQASRPQRDIPVIVLSVLGEIKDVAEAYQRGANTFLIKPLDGPQLLQTIQGIPGLQLKAHNDGFVFAPTEQPPVSPGLLTALDNVDIDPPPAPPAQT